MDNERQPVEEACRDLARKEFMDKHDGWVEANTSKHKAAANSAKELVPKKNVSDQADNTNVDLEGDYENQDRELANNWPGDVED